MRKHRIKRRRRQITYLVIAIAALLMALTGILTVDATSQDGTFLNANDHDLWSAVSVMVDGADATHNSWIASHVQTRASPSPFVSLVAISYRFINELFHYSLTDEPIATTRILLAIVNLPLLLIFLAASITCIEKIGGTSWSRFSSVAIASFATMLLPLTTSLNSQLPAAAATAVTLWLYLFVADRLEHSQVISPRVWTTAGFTAAIAGTFHFPAALMIVPWLVLFGRLDTEEVKPFLGGVALAAAFLGCSLSLGPHIDTKTIEPTNAQIVAADSRARPADISLDAPENKSKVNPLSTKLPNGVITTPLHALIGHHGLLSLTPIWLLLPLAFIRGIRLEPPDFSWLSIAVLTVSLGCALMATGLVIAGRGPMGSGLELRQVYLSQTIWMTPLWLVMLTPKIEELGINRFSKSIVIALFAASTLSALSAFPSLTAFPWLFHLWLL